MNEKVDRGLESLKLWQRSIAFAKNICSEILPLLPSDEKYSMISQLRRSCQSVPANIAEGYGRYYFQDNVRYCYIARGSLEETFSHLKLARELDYLDNDIYDSLCNEIQEMRRMLNGYTSYLKTSKRGSTEPGANLHIREAPTDYMVDDQTNLIPD
jgi:four helix bundle protein